MSIRFLLSLFAFSTLFATSICQALDAKISKLFDANGTLAGVRISTPKVIFEVSAYGYLEKVYANDPKREAYQELDSQLGDHSIPLPPQKHLSIKYHPKSAMDGNSGKIAQVEGIPVIYFPCRASIPTFNSIQYNGQNVSPAMNPGDSPLSMNTRYQQACQSLDGNGGKVQRIGNISFSYYPYNSFQAFSGRLQSVNGGPSIP